MSDPGITDLGLAIQRALPGFTWSDLESAAELARIARLSPERAREVGVYYGRDSEQLVHHLAELLGEIVSRLLRHRPQRRRPERQGTPPEARRPRLIAALALEPRGMSELVELLGITPDAVSAVICRARRAGVQIQYDGGCYSLQEVPDGPTDPRD